MRSLCLLLDWKNETDKQIKKSPRTDSQNEIWIHLTPTAHGGRTSRPAGAESRSSFGRFVSRQQFTTTSLRYISGSKQQILVEGGRRGFSTHHKTVELMM